MQFDGSFLIVQPCNSEGLATPPPCSFSFGTAELNQQPRKRLHGCHHCSVPGIGEEE